MAEQKLTIDEQEAKLKADLAEFQRTKAQRKIVEALEGGWIPQGTRLVHPDNKEDGRVIVFTPEEAASLVAPIRKIVDARNAPASK